MPFEFSFRDRTKRKPLPPKPMQVVVNPVTGKRVEILQNQYDNWQNEINRILDLQKQCKDCHCAKCPQPIPYYVQVIQALGGDYTIAVKPCPHHRRSIPEHVEQQETPKLVLGPDNEIPPLYKNLALSDFQVTAQNSKAVERVKEFMKNQKPDRGLFITGPKGTGKTMLACIATGEKARQGETVMFQDMSELIETLSRGPETEIDRVSKLLKSVPFLVLDDLGIQALTENAAVQLAMILNYRTAHKRPMIVTSCYTMGELQTALNPNGTPQSKDKLTYAIRRMVSRLAQSSNIVFLNGKDRRILDQMQRLNTGLFG